MNTAISRDVMDTSERIVPALPDSAAIIQVIERAALNPNVDIDKMQRLLDMQERILDRNAKASYAVALAMMQPSLPQVERNGKIVIRDKNDNKKIIQSTPYALWEDINDAIRPMLAENGFALSFRTGTTPEGKVTVTGILSHRDGHQEETTITLMQDSSGSKNAVQAIGSSISYGKRYTAGLLLNITSRAPNEADDDGEAAGAAELISDEQVREVSRLIAATKSDLPIFLKTFEIQGIPEIKAKDLPRVMTALEAKRAKLAKGVQP